MEKAKMALTGFLMATAMVCLAAIGIVYIREKEQTARETDQFKLSKVGSAKDKELEIGLYNQYTHCLRTVMQESRSNSRPCDVKEAERVCSRLSEEKAEAQVEAK